MATKRRRSDDDDCNGSSSSSMNDSTKTPSKASNTGKNMDLVSMTQMLLSFGQSQQLQLQRRKDLDNNSNKALASCWSCQKSGTGTANQTEVSSNCNHCSKPICGRCIQLCCCCGQDFCSVCSIYDYSEYATRSVCLDCNR